jgi:hypothetical protein
VGAGVFICGNRGMDVVTICFSFKVLDVHYSPLICGEPGWASWLFLLASKSLLTGHYAWIQRTCALKVQRQWSAGKRVVEGWEWGNCVWMALANDVALWELRDS